MDQPRVWSLPRYVTLLVVLALHLAVLAALVMGSRSQQVAPSANDSVELLFLPPPPYPKVRAENFLPRRLSGDTAITVAPPVLDSALPSGSSPASGTEGNGSGSGVDWAAEARRAVRAFDIRSHESPRNSSVSGSPAEEHWWPRARHHPGEQFKTPSGDWIVWISASCYQVASSAATPALGALPPRTFCPGEANARGEKTAATN